MCCVRSLGRSTHWSRDLPLAALLHGHFYLAIYNVDDRFWRDNVGLLTPSVIRSATGVYRVVEEGGQMVRLEPVRQRYAPLE